MLPAQNRRLTSIPDIRLGADTETPPARLNTPGGRASEKLAMLRITLTSRARDVLRKILAREHEETPEAVFRIRETRRGIYDAAVYELRLGLDEQTENDETATCGGMRFVAERDFLALRGDAPTFYIVTDKRGLPSVHPFNACSPPEPTPRDE